MYIGELSHYFNFVINEPPSSLDIAKDEILYFFIPL